MRGSSSQRNRPSPRALPAFLPNRYATGGSGRLEGGIHLPAGALITEIEIAGCDNNLSVELGAQLIACGDPSGACSTVAEVFSPTTGAPGCAFFSAPPPAAHAIDNLNNTYLITVHLGNNPTLSFRNVRVFYRLQVSPDPASATFADVPVGHPQHRFVEALAAAGITAGCGGGDYCPNTPVIRGQMAVFLSVALGLHHPF